MNNRLTAGHKAVTVFLFAVLVWLLFDLPLFRPFFEGMGTPDDDTMLASALHEEDGDRKQSLSVEQLRAHIEAEAHRRNIPAIDAKLDPIWKAVPGYNGLEIDVETTFKLAKKSGGDIPWVYEEVPPRISLEDLGAQPIYKGNPHKKMVALAINVAWGEEYLPSMLETLQRENVSATFFFDGSWLAKQIDLAREIKEAGHELSNHGYSHRNMSELSRGVAAEEILKTERLLENELGVHNRLFAPPSGDYDMETVQIAHEFGLKTVLWTLDTVDWKKPSPQVILQRIVPRLESGAIILMHPTEPTDEALPTLIGEIKNKGYALGTVSDLLSPNRVGDVERLPLFW